MFDFTFWHSGDKMEISHFRLPELFIVAISIRKLAINLVELITIAWERAEHPDDPEAHNKRGNDDAFS